MAVAGVGVARAVETLVTDDFNDGDFAGWTAGGPGAGAVYVDGALRARLPANNQNGTFLERSFARTADPVVRFTFDWEPAAPGLGVQTMFSLLDSRTGQGWEFIATPVNNLGTGSGYAPNSIPGDFPDPSGDNLFTLRFDSAARTLQLYRGSALVAQHVSAKTFDANSRPPVVDTFRVTNNADFGLGRENRFDDVRVTGRTNVVFDDDFNDGDYTAAPAWTASHPAATSVDADRRLVLNGVSPDGKSVTGAFPAITAGKVVVRVDAFNGGATGGHGTMGAILLRDSVGNKTAGLLGSGVNNMSNGWGLMTAGNAIVAGAGSFTRFDDSWQTFVIELDLATGNLVVTRNGANLFGTVATTLTRVDEIQLVFTAGFNNAAWNLFFDNVLVSREVDPFTEWQLRYFGCTNCPPAAPDADALGKGVSNANQFRVGLDPTNSAALYRVTEIVRTGNDVQITWQTSGGDWSGHFGAAKTNVLEFAQPTGGGFTNAFTSTGITNIIPLNPVAPGNVTRTVTDPGGATNHPARYYRLRSL